MDRLGVPSIGNKSKAFTILQANKIIRVSLNSVQNAIKTSYLSRTRFVNLSFNSPVSNLTGMIESPEHILVAKYASKLNILRFLAICSIVWGHSIGAFENMAFTNTYSHALQMAMIELGKIGTVIFFLISGFFLANKIHKFNVVTYLRYRLFSLIIPWLCFLTIFVIIQMMHSLPLSQFTQQSPITLLTLFINLYKAFIFHATYWFIPVAILSACLLITFKNQINTPWFIMLLLTITIFYGINLYHGWISANHTKAFLAYLFFVWLGAQVRYRIQLISKFAENVSWSVLLPVLATLFFVACLEGAYLKHVACSDPYASIRLSNWLLSTGIFLAFLKTNRLTWINYLKPQSYVYGVYLIHCIIINELAPFIRHLISLNSGIAIFPKLISIQLLAFVLVMMLSYLITFLLKKSPVRYIMGTTKH